MAQSPNQAVLQVTQSLILQLALHGLNPEIVVADKRRQLDPKVYKRTVVLPFLLQDWLTSDEWRPLIASSLIFDRDFTKRKIAVSLSYTFFPYWTFPFIVVALAILGISPVPQPYSIILLLGWILVGYLIARVLYARYFRRLQMTADRQTLQLAIMPSLVDVLKRVETLDVLNSRDSRRLRRRLWDLDNHSRGSLKGSTS